MGMELTMSMELEQNPKCRTAEERDDILSNPGFGMYFTDHMVRVDYADGEWGRGRVMPYGPIALEPATSVFHYAQEVFEGLKAYRQADGGVALFRPEANAQRFARSAIRLQMPALPEELFIESLYALVEVDRNWVPTKPDNTLYLRPLMIATDIGLGVNAPSSTYSYYVIGSPVGSYFGGGIRPVKVWLSTEYTRAAPGGTGEAKCGGNYAAAFAGQAQAVEAGCDQVVWLDAAEHRWVEEMGGMNLCFVYGSGSSARLLTPALSGTLLPGITRDSLLTLAASAGYEVEEGPISVDVWQSGCASGEITEVFACGTAAVITPVGFVASKEGGWTIGDGTPGPVSMQLRETLTGIQAGTVADTHGWMTYV
jgi:branched-chain amino acid aminotransferase